MNRPTCKTCVYWHKLHSAGDKYWSNGQERTREKDGGECRKGPPVLTWDSDGFSWPERPQVDPEYWCGEHPDFPKYIKSLEGGDA